ncbi:MAG TPA: LysM domain-containing protein, partial [Candidatus Saccharimonadales bacterium]|nr:LysM domain-containing protein [Candidatus Saccharimonadales bacterium]
MAKQPKAAKHQRTIRQNVRPGLLLLLLPLLGGVAVFVVFASGLYSKSLSAAGDKRLETQNWQQADKVLTDRQPNYDRKYGYYKVKVGQTLASIADYFSVDEKDLAALNPGLVVAGTTIKVPPVTRQLAPTAGPNGKLTALAGVTVTNDRGLLRINQQYSAQQVVTDIPELMAFLKQYDAIEQTGPLAYRINKSISIQGNIRVDITSTTV